MRWSTNLGQENLYDVSSLGEHQPACHSNKQDGVSHNYLVQFRTLAHQPRTRGDNIARAASPLFVTYIIARKLTQHTVGIRPHEHAVVYRTPAHANAGFHRTPDRLSAQHRVSEPEGVASRVHASELPCTSTLAAIGDVGAVSYRIQAHV